MFWTNGVQSSIGVLKVRRRALGLRREAGQLRSERFGRDQSDEVATFLHHYENFQ